MEDVKRENNNKTKRTRFEQVKQVATAYLQRRNYPFTSEENISLEDFLVSCQIENGISRPNSVLYSCFNNDPLVMDQTYTKFILWIKELLKHNKKKYDDLELLIGPLFCHIYLEILRGGHTERAANFLKIHLATVDRSKCDGLIQELINAIVNDTIDMPIIKEHFRSNKYSVELTEDCILILKQFLSESGHIVLLQIFQSWFIIEEKEIMLDSELGNDKVIVSDNKVLCNGHVDNSKTNSVSMQKLLDAIEDVAAEHAPVYSVNISNLKDSVSCGVLNRQHGICAYSYNNSIFIRSLQTLQQLESLVVYGEAVLLGHSAEVFDIVFFKPHKHLISASQDKTIKLFDVKNYELVRTYKGHEYPVYCLSASVNGEFFTSGSYDHTSRLWCVSRKETLRVFIGHTQQVTSVDFHSNCTYVATGSADKNIRMWSIKDADPVRLLLGSKGAVFALRFSPSGQYLISSGEDKRLQIWDIASSKQLIDFKIASNPIIKMAISDDHKLLATASIDGIVKIWNLEHLIKNAPETNLIDPLFTLTLNPIILSLDYCFSTFGCFTAQQYDTINL